MKIKMYTVRVKMGLMDVQYNMAASSSIGAIMKAMDTYGHNARISAKPKA